MNKKPCLLTQRRNNQQGAWRHRRRHAWEAGSLHPHFQENRRPLLFLRVSSASLPSMPDPCRCFKGFSMYSITFPGTFIRSFPCNTALNLGGLKVKGSVQVQAKCSESFRHLFRTEKWNSKLEGDMQLSPQASWQATGQKRNRH